MDYASAICFDDLVNSNINYLQGYLGETPSYSGPPHPETSFIIQHLVDICGKGVLTTSSQPACVADMKRQRGYIQGALKGDIQKFAELLDQHTNLEYALVTHRPDNIYLESIDSDNISDDQYRVWRFSQINVGGRWDTSYGECMIDDGESMIEDFFHYNTEEYSLTDDDDVIYFIVSDEVYGLPMDNCCNELMRVLMMMEEDDA